MWMKRKIHTYLQKVYVFTYGRFHKIEKKVLFESFGGKQYSDSPRAISEKLHKIYPEYQIVWKLNRNFKDKYNIVPNYIKVISTEKEFLKELATSMCYVTNENMEPQKYKRRKQLFIQTWHGDRGFKKILYETWLKRKRPIPITDNKVTDFCVAASEYGENMYRDAFNYQGNIMKVGMPRNDKLVKIEKDEIEKVKKSLGIPNNMKILLFAPTFRDNISLKQEVLIDIDRILQILEQKGEEWMCLVRAHSTSKGLNVKDNNQRIVNVTDYPDMADLLLISDMLITDYSSSAGDFILMRKPVILAVFDYKEYIENSRNLKFPIEDSGFIIAYNQKELENIIATKNLNDYYESCERVKTFYGIVETGEASRQICDEINKFAKLHKYD